MKPFHFSLQSLRLLRGHKEQAAQRRFAEALRTSESAAARLKAGSRELTVAWTVLGREMAAGTAMSNLRQTRAWCDELERRRHQLTVAFKAAERVAQNAWQEMAIASRDREALDRLREKHRRAFDREAQRLEQKQLDEMGLRVNPPARALRRPAAIGKGAV